MSDISESVVENVVDNESETAIEEQHEDDDCTL